MPIHHDQTARVPMEGLEQPASSETGHGQVGNVADEMRAIMRLIATQIEESDRRHSDALTKMYERLHELSREAQMSRSKSPASYAPAFERIREGIEQLAGLVAPTENETAATAHSGTTAKDTSTDELMITDNAADRMHYAYDEFEEPESSSEGNTYDEHLAIEEPAPTAHSEANEAQYTRSAFAARTARAVERPYSSSVEGNADQPWDLESAEALTRVYEEELGSVSRAPEVSRTAMMATAPSTAAPAAPSTTAPANRSPQSYGMKIPAFSQGPSFDYDNYGKPANSENNNPASGISSVTPAIEQAWLEERFCEIAAKIEETFAELRDDEALNALTDRFGDFEQRMGHALEEVATRQDLDALKAAEDQIDSMAGYFERVEAKLARIDNLEAQMEAMLDRFSDDRLMELLQNNNSGSEADYSSIADAAAESAAQRFLADFKGNGSGDGEAVAEMREALEAFMSERREHDHEAAGMLDTIQQALIRVLDRVDVLESGHESVPMADPRGDHFDDEIETAPVGEPSPIDEPGYDAAAFEVAEPAAIGEDHLGAEAEDQFEAESASVREIEDYTQRLEYPAAVQSGRGNGGIPEQFRPETPMPPQLPETATAQDFASPDFATQDFGNQDFAGPEAYEVGQFEVPEEAAYPANEATVEPQIAPYPQDMVAEQAAPSAPHMEVAGQLAPEELSKGNAIERLRREFIEDAKRARENANQQAVKGEAPAAQSSSLVGKLAMPNLSGLSLKIPGMAKAEPQSEAAVAAPARRPHKAGPVPQIPDEEPAAKSRFSMPRSKILVGAVIVLFATAGALLMMRGKSQTVDTAPPPAIEQTVEPAGDGPEMNGPEINEPAGDRQGSLEEGRVYDDGLQYDVAPANSGHAMNETPAGVAVSDLDKGVDLHALTKAQNQRALAKLSSDLGTAASYATPANLMQQGTAPTTGAAAPLTESAKGNQLDLPPATVGPLSLRLAAAKGDPSAQFEVAARLAGGTGTKQDLKGAVHWYQLSAAQGFAQAQYRLGTLYERGIGLDKDLARASLWYTRAASAGNVKAMHNLAVVSVNRTKGGSDYKAAAKWFAMAAQYGLGDSQFNMAVLHENGLGATKDLSKAYFYYALAAGKGDPQAVKHRDAIRVKLSPSALSKVEKEVKVFRPKRADRLVNDARTAGEDWKKRADGSY